MAGHLAGRGHLSVQLSEALLLWALFWQTLEWLRLKSESWPTSLSGWTQELPGPVAWLISPPCYQAVLYLQLSLIGLQTLAPTRLGWFALLASTVICQWRWRGNFNGGSDRMTVVLLLARVLPAPVGDLYAAVQLTLSYWVAGGAKLASAGWRNGSAMQDFLELYQAPPIPRRYHLGLSWAAMFWQLAFPLAWLGGPWLAFFSLTGLMFHLANWRLFGLNRFLWIWMAAYPCLWLSLP
jgi:hypothetical protein